MTWAPGDPSLFSDEIDVFEYTLTINPIVGDGLVAPLPGTYTFLGGSKVKVMATPNPRSKFRQWGGDTSAMKDYKVASSVVTMDRNITVGASFYPVVDLYIVNSGGGATNPPMGTYEVEAGKKIIIKAIAAEGWKFDRWEGDISGTQDTTELTPEADTNVCAVFVPDASTTTTSQYKLYYATDTKKIFWNIDDRWEFVATLRHSLLEELGLDDHPQYLTTKRHDTPERHSFLKAGYWEPVVIGNSATPEFVVTTDGDIVMVEVT